MLAHELVEFARIAVARDIGVGVAFRTMDRCHVGLAQSGRRLDQRIEHRLQIEGRAADDLEHVGGGGLLLQRFAQLVEQPRVLNGDDGLIGEGLDQRDLLVGEDVRTSVRRRRDRADRGRLPRIKGTQRTVWTPQRRAFALLSGNSSTSASISARWTVRPSSTGSACNRPTDQREQLDRDRDLGGRDEGQADRPSRRTNGREIVGLAQPRSGYGQRVEHRLQIERSSD